jgi:hypothetical protein
MAEVNDMNVKRTVINNAHRLLSVLSSLLSIQEDNVEWIFKVTKVKLFTLDNQHNLRIIKTRHG